MQTKTRKGGPRAQRMPETTLEHGAESCSLVRFLREEDVVCADLSRLRVCQNFVRLRRCVWWGRGGSNISKKVRVFRDVGGPGLPPIGTHYNTISVFNRYLFLSKNPEDYIIIDTLVGDGQEHFTFTGM